MKDIENKNRFEFLCGLLIAIFAAILAIVDLGAGKYGDDELIAINEKSSTYDWFNSKSIKQSNLEGQLGLLQALDESGAIDDKDTNAIHKHMEKLNKKIAKYEKEKTEIMLGSDSVGQANWIQDVDGELGKVKGAEQWEREALLLGKAGDTFDMGILFLQISLVMGAVALVLQNASTKRVFLIFMILLGLLGAFYGINAIIDASSI